MQIFNLSGEDWHFKHSRNGAYHPAAVPGCIHTDLIDAELIPDPYYRDNEKDLLWIGWSDWLYVCVFDVPGELLKEDRVILRCEGLDTVATVTLNGNVIGETDNMFRVYEFDVKSLLKLSGNRIEVSFKSPIRACNDLQRQRNPGLAPHVYEHPRMNKNMLRKEQCNFGWDWGPVCVTCGIWKPIRMVGYSDARIVDAAIRQTNLTDKVARLDIAIELEKTTDNPVTVDICVMHESRTVAVAAMKLAHVQGVISLDIRNPKRWWPAGMGDQPLYTVKVDVSGADGETLDTVNKTIGLRTLKLTRKRDKAGESFAFEANGVPFFAKGANWIPADTFLNRVTPDRYRSLLKNAVDANMNMLRVWGGGIYEKDAFYDVCDELGICIWQDFMFACAPYPANDPEFMENVKLEAEQNVKRISHHACLALWCGNNEMEADRQCVSADGRFRSMLWQDYYPLFDVLLKETVRKYAPGVEYWPSSPHSPLGDREDADNQSCGDAHLWSAIKVDDKCRSTSPRFVSEIGVIGFPEPKTVKEFTIPSDRNIASRVMEHHQRGGNAGTMMSGMLKCFPMPNGFENTLWLSQIHQGDSIRHAVEHWRRMMPHCMGSLYWQFNDCWHVASWASVDYRGRWKALHYMAKRFYAPLMVSGVEDVAKGTVDIHVTSDLKESVSGTVSWRATDIDGRLLRKGSRKLRMAGLSSRKVETVRLGDLAEAHEKRGLLVWLELEAAGQPVSRNLVFFARPKHLDLHHTPGLTSRAVRKPDGSFDVVLETRHPALWVWVELDGIDARVSDNFFHLCPGAALTVNVMPERALSAQAFKRCLIVRSLVDTYLSASSLPSGGRHGQRALHNGSET